MKALVYWPLLLSIVLLDVISKAIAQAALGTMGMVRPVIGQVVRFTLVYNRGAAFGLSLGSQSRWIFMGLTIGALIILWRLYRQTHGDDLRRATAIGLVSAGAIGNLIDRLRDENGVIDFIDVGFGVHRWPTFNVADMAVSSGAFLLALVLWNEEQRMKELSELGAVTSDPAGVPAVTDHVDMTEPR